MRRLGLGFFIEDAGAVDSDNLRHRMFYEMLPQAQITAGRR